MKIISSWSTISLEDVAEAVPGGYRWFQLYVAKVHFVLIHVNLFLLPNTLLLNHTSSSNTIFYYTGVCYLCPVFFDR